MEWTRSADIDANSTGPLAPAQPVEDRLRFDDLDKLGECAPQIVTPSTMSASRSWELKPTIPCSQSKGDAMGLR